jgi:FtsZ-binding cell division protein ZapB
MKTYSETLLEEQVERLKRENATLRAEIDRSCNAEELRRLRADNERLRAILACYRG